MEQGGWLYWDMEKCGGCWDIWREDKINEISQI